MDSGSTFPRRRGGFERAVPGPEGRNALRKGQGRVRPPRADLGPPRKGRAYRHADRTKTDTGGRVRRRTKARERNLVKELGNTAP